MLREPILAGKFYEADPSVLRKRILAELEPKSQTFPESIADVVPEVSRMPWPCEPVVARGVLLPHAGHMYCGKVIGQTLSRCTLPRRLILLCPNHTGQGTAPLSVWPEGAWRTPLGDVTVDTELTSTLIAAGSGFGADVTAHAGEHSLEVLLPYLQVHSPDSVIAPVRVSCRAETLFMAGMALAGVIREFAKQGEDVGLIISSDLNHYAPEAENQGRDARAIQLFLGMDPIALFNSIQQEEISMCGVCPAALALFALKTLEQASPLPTPHLVAYTTSAEASGDASSVVGYAGIVLN